MGFIAATGHRGLECRVAVVKHQCPHLWDEKSAPKD